MQGFHYEKASDAFYSAVVIDPNNTEALDGAREADTRKVFSLTMPRKKKGKNRGLLRSVVLLDYFSRCFVL